MSFTPVAPPLAAVGAAGGPVDEQQGTRFSVVRLTLTERAQTSFGEIAFGVLGDGPPVVLVHGTPSRAAVWQRVVPALAGCRRVFVLDLLGFGDSERRVDQQLSIAVHAQVLRELVDRWQLDRPAMVGHDIGGAAVLRAHLVDGAPVSRIALIDAVVLSPWITPHTRQMQRAADRYDSLPDRSLGASIRRHLSSATSRPLDPETFERLFAQWEGAEGQALYLRNLASFDEADTEDVEPLLPSISVPVLILWGEEDAWLPVATSERIAALIPNARRVLIPNAGHFSMEDEPETIARELRRFLG